MAEPHDSHRRLVIVSDARPKSEPQHELPEAGELMQVGDLAKATGKTVRAIHLYEDLGLLKPQDRSKGRYRLFSHDAVVRVRWIAKLQHLGLSLNEIQEIVRQQEDMGSAKQAAARLREVYSEKLTETRDKLLELKALEAELTASLSYLSSCDTSCVPAIPVDTCNHCDLHPDPDNAPELILGVHAS